jgi:hypothetical protein
MSRWVVPDRSGLKAGATEPKDGPAGRVVKYVPAEVVAAYTLLFTALVTLNLPVGQSPWAAVGLIVLFCVVTIGYVANRTIGKVRQAHLIVSPLAFLAWAYPISSAVLGDLFFPLAAFVAQAIVIALSIIIAPREDQNAPAAPGT